MPNNNIAILVVAPDPADATCLCGQLSNSGYDPTAALTAQETLSLLSQKSYPIIIIIISNTQPMDTIYLLKRIKAHDRNVSVILLSDSATIDAAAEHIRHGAYDFIGKPFENAELELILRRAVEKRALTEHLRRLGIRNLLLALSIPFWVLLGYFLSKLF